MDARNPVLRESGQVNFANTCDKAGTIVGQVSRSKLEEFTDVDWNFDCGSYMLGMARLARGNNIVKIRIYVNININFQKSSSFTIFKIRGISKIHLFSMRFPFTSREWKLENIITYVKKQISIQVSLFFENTVNTIVPIPS